jgi:S1-C subfamily serine protease
MSKKWLQVMTAALVLTTSPLLASVEEEKSCPAKVDDCVRQMKEDLAKRGWVGINMEVDEQAGGVVLTRVFSDSPGERAGLRVGDLLTSLNGVPYDEANEEELKKEYMAFRPGGTATFGIERGSEALEITVTLAPLPEEILAKWIGEHVLHAHGGEQPEKVD